MAGVVTTILLMHGGARGEPPPRVPVGTQQLTGFTGFGKGYVWKSSHELVFLTRDEEDRLQYGQFDVVSGRQTIFPPIDRSEIVPPIDRSGARYRILSISPNGKWLLSMDRSDHPQWIVRQLGGARRFGCPPKVGNGPWEATWTRDNHGWVELTFSNKGSKLWVHTISNPRIVTSADVPGLTTLEELLGITTDNHAIVRVNGMTQFVDVDLGSSHRRPRWFTADPPSGAYSVTLSSDGRRLAWVTLSVSSPPGFLTRYFPQLGLHDHWHVGVWVSDLAGKRATEIAHWEMDPLPVHAGLFQPVWTPDGKHLSVVWRSNLWLFPVGS
jgi:hypothetical protein